MTSVNATLFMNLFRYHDTCGYYSVLSTTQDLLATWVEKGILGFHHDKAGKVASYWYLTDSGKALRNLLEI